MSKMTMKEYENSKEDKAMDKRMGYKEGSKKDRQLDKKMLAKKNKDRKAYNSEGKKLGIRS